MKKNLLVTSVDFLGYTKFVVDKQPTEEEIRHIVNLYVEEFHPTHLAISIPLDDNADFLINGHIPSPLTVDEFTRVWITAIHDAGVSVYYRGTFCGIEGIYDFDSYITIPLGKTESAKQDGKQTWMGKTYQWLHDHIHDFKEGDILGIIPDQTVRPLDFYVELGNLCNEVIKETQLKMYTGYSSHFYTDIISGKVSTLLFDLAGVMSVDYFEYKKSPQIMEKEFNDLYTAFRQPILLNGWQIPDESLTTKSVDDRTQEYFEVFSRLKDKGILIGINYFEELGFEEGLTKDDEISTKGMIVQDFFKKNTVPKEKITKVPNVIVNLDKQKTKKSKPRKKVIKKESIKSSPVLPLSQKPIDREKPTKKDMSGSERKIKFSRVLSILIYLIIGSLLTIGTNFFTKGNLVNLTVAMVIGYTLLASVIHFLFGLHDK